MKKEDTYIRIKREVKNKLKDFRITDRESYSEVIKRFIEKEAK